MVPLSPESGIPLQTDNSRLHLPIEGVTAWPYLLRLIAAGSFVMIMLLAFILTLLIPPEQLQVNPEQLLIGLTGLLVFEIVIVRRLIVPMNGDYGRYRINEGKVDFYPLSTLGLSVLTRTQSVPIIDFNGVEVQIMAGRGSETKYMVALMHPERSNMIRIRAFTSRSEAEDYARNLAAALSLPVIAAA